MWPRHWDSRKPPLRIECYDISNTVGGAFQVASMVVFEDAIAKKSEYRRFAIRGKDGKGAVDDLSALYETLTRPLQARQHRRRLRRKHRRGTACGLGRRAR